MGTANRAEGAEAEVDLTGVEGSTQSTSERLDQKRWGHKGKSGKREGNHCYEGPFAQLYQVFHNHFLIWAFKKSLRIVQLRA